MLAAHCHSEQMAVRRMTCEEERRLELLRLGEGELTYLRDLVVEWLDVMYVMASEGRRRRYPITSADRARGAGGVLVEWVSARQVHPPGSQPAQVYLEALRNLWSYCSDAPVDGCGGEGRAAFTARTGRRRHGAGGGGANG